MSAKKRSIATINKTPLAGGPLSAYMQGAISVLARSRTAADTPSAKLSTSFQDTGCTNRSAH